MDEKRTKPYGLVDELFLISSLHVLSVLVVKALISIFNPKKSAFFAFAVANLLLFVLICLRSALSIRVISLISVIRGHLFFSLFKFVGVKFSQISNFQF